MTEPDNKSVAANATPSDPSTTSPGKTTETAETATDQQVTYQAKLEEVADLIARVRHEINNPLTGVLGQAQLLLREDLSDKARKRAETIEQLAIRIRDIVAQLRQVQKT